MTSWPRLGSLNVPRDSTAIASPAPAARLIAAAPPRKDCRLIVVFIRPSVSSVAPALLGGPSTVDDQLAAGHVGRLVGGQIEDAVRHLVGLAVPAERDPGDHQLAYGVIGAPPLGHRGHDRSRMHRVRADALARVLHGRGLRQQADGALGGLVLRATVIGADQAELGRDVDDRSAAGPAHGRDRGLRAEEYALGIDVHRARPVLHRRVLDPAPAADPRVVDQDVESPEAARGETDGSLPVSLAGDVEPDEGSLTAFGLDVGLDRLAFGHQDVADDHARAVAREQARLGGAHAARTPADQRYLAGKSHGRLARASGDGRDTGSAAEAALALLVGTDRAQEVDLAEGRPVRVAEVELAVGALPQEEAREPDLTAGADDEVRIREIGRIEVLADRLLGDAVDDGLEVFALLAPFAEHGLNGVDDLLAAPVGDREREDHLAIAGRCLFGGPDGGDRGVGQEVELTNGADAETETLELRMPGERGELRFDGGQDSGYLRRRPSEVARREHPEADGRNADLGAPLADVVEPLGAERVCLPKVGHAPLEGKAAVAVEDDAEMPGNGAVPYLTEQEPRVEVIEEAAHRRNLHASSLGPNESRTGFARARSRAITAGR